MAKKDKTKDRDSRDDSGGTSSSSSSAATVRAVFKWMGTAIVAVLIAFLARQAQLLANEYIPPLSHYTWTPTNSSVLSYNASSNPLYGINGIFVINLDRRPDRLKAFMKRSSLTATDFHRFSAIDGRNLTWNNEINSLFINNKFLSRASRIGCAMSHLTLYRHIANTTNERYIIFEDDAYFADKNWINKWNAEYYPNLPSDADLVFLGGLHPLNDPGYRELAIRVNAHFNQHQRAFRYRHSYDPPCDKDDPNTTPRRRYPYTGIAYMLSSHGARVLVAMLEECGFIQPADIMRIKLMDLVEGAYTAEPLIVNLPPTTKHVAHADDSDIQYEADPIRGAPASNLNPKPKQ